MCANLLFVFFLGIIPVSQNNTKKKEKKARVAICFGILVCVKFIKCLGIKIDTHLFLLFFYYYFEFISNRDLSEHDEDETRNSNGDT